jgi:hypothetical protein
MTMEPLRIFAPCGMLGYGIPEHSFACGLARDPHVLAVDAGSTDPGPYYLGTGLPFTNRNMVKRDLTLILRAGYERQIPIIIGTAGGSGARPHLTWLAKIIDEINREQGLRFPTAVIPSDVAPAYLKQRVREHAVFSFEFDQVLSDEEIDRSSQIVAQMGPEPIMQALSQAQLVVCGRASDPAVMGAPALMRGYPTALTVHLGKILECGAAAAQPRHGTDGLLGTLYEDYFLVEPSNPIQTCTVESVAAHTLYERANPLRSRWPGGTLDLSGTRFEQYDDRAVKISGSQYFDSDDYLVKIEGAARCGYRTITIAGTRDPLLQAEFEAYEQNFRQRVATVVAPLQAGIDYRLYMHAYGRNGVMGAAEPERQGTGHELGLIIEVIAETEEISRQVLAASRSAALHSTYPGRKAIAGNLAFPFSPSDIGVGDAYEFNIYHLLRLEQPLEIFPILYTERSEAIAHVLDEPAIV